MYKVRYEYVLGIPCVYSDMHAFRENGVCAHCGVIKATIEPSKRRRRKKQQSGRTHTHRGGVGR